MTAAASPDILLGTVLEGRYQLLSVLGRGGMGSVYIAEDIHLHRRCAVKVLHPQFAEDRTNVERFLREAQMIARLQHPNIVDIYAYGEDPSGLVFFAMELLEGEDLYRRLKARDARPYSVHEACLWALQVTRAVGCVHEAGLIHRDLKTPNIFLARKRDGEEVVKLLDFGIARPEEGSELTQTGMLLGTPTYMSPEQIQNLDLDRRTDIYSFGVLLFKLVTGRFPFQGEMVQIAMAHCQTPPPRPSQIAPDAGISPALEAIILRALEKRPADRFQSMLEIEAALTTLLHDEAPGLLPVSRATPAAAGVSSIPAPIPPAAPAAPRLVIRDEPTEATQVFSPGPSAAPAPASDRRRLWIGLGVAVAAGVAALSLQFGDPTRPATPLPDAPAPPVAAAPSTLAPPVAERVETIPDPDPEPAPAPDPVPTPAVAPAPSEPSPEVEPTEPGAKAKAANPARAAAPPDPRKEVQRRAAACRRKHKAVGGPLVTIDYAVGVDGSVTRSIPSIDDPLGACLAEAVRKTRFEPKLVFGRKIQL